MRKFAKPAERDSARKRLPHAEIATVDGTNHMMPLQDPDAVGHLIQAFVMRHGSRKAGPAGSNSRYSA
jgi:pimeloyl-ACP methyl ester carboxylesterase